MMAMRAGLLFAAVGVAVSVLGLALVVQGAGTSSYLRTLDDENFEHVTQAATGATTGDWFIEFYAPWCGHCKHLAPVWSEVADELAGKINVAAVDASANSKLAARFRIRGYPSLVYLRHGDMYSYRGRRDKDSLLAFANGGYEKVDATPVPPMPTMVDEIKLAFQSVFEDVLIDIRRGNYMSPRVLMLAVPLVFALLTFGLIFLSPPLPPPAPRRRQDGASAAAAAADAAPSSNKPHGE